MDADAVSTASSLDLFDEGTLDEYPCEELDQQLFGPEWIASIEALDSVGDQELYDDATTDGFVPMDWEQDHAAMEQSLNQLGMDDLRLSFQQGEELALVSQLLEHLGLVMTSQQVEWHRRRFAVKIKNIKDAQPMAKRLRGDHLSPDSQRIRDAGSSKAVRNLVDESQNLGESQLPLPGRRFKENRSSRLWVGTREEQERADQDHWTEVVIGILSKAGAPLIEMAAESINKEAVLRGAIGSTRGSTMESYCKALKPLVQWLEDTNSQAWPATLIQIIDFLHMAGNKPCSPSYPRRFGQSFSWFERIGNWAESERLSGQELLTRTIAYWTEALRAGIRPLKQAARYPWAMMASLELYVLDQSQPKHKRYKAWTMLVKAWGTMREDDLQHLSPGKFRAMGELLVSELMRSKTSGASKRVRELPIAIWTGVTLTRNLWLETGMGLMDELTLKTNDYLLPAFDSLGAPMQRPMTYLESACLSRAVIRDLKEVIYDRDAEVWKEGSGRLIPESLISLWTEHSARPVVPSAGQVLEFLKDECNYLGRWSPGGSADYTRAFRTVAQSIQTRVWRAVLSGDKRLFEHEVLDRVTSWGEARGWKEEESAEQKAGLLTKVKAYWDEVAKAGGPPEETSPVTVEPVAGVAERPLPQLPRKGVKNRYLIVFSRNRRHAKLHRIGGCQWTQLTLADSQEIRHALPELYSSRCKLCWPQLLGQDLNVEAESSAESEL